MKKVLLAFICLSILAAAARPDDLYRVWVESEVDAAQLRGTGVKAVVRVDDGYLVMADRESLVALENSPLKIELVTSAVEMDDLALDIDHDRSRSPRFPAIYEEGGLRLYRVPSNYWMQAKMEDQLAPIMAGDLPITYTSRLNYNSRAAAGIADLDSIIDLISQDSLDSYSHRLETFYRRWAGTDSMMAASAWIKSKFESFGYDSVVFDSFTFYSSTYGLRQCRNVVVTKVGNRHPEWEVIVGAHMDAGRVSPGADDNGSGTVGTLEIARVLANIDTDVTFRFITFDGEEWGLYGSWFYSNRAAARGDHIVYMLNMDMIAHYTNDTQANLYYGSETAFSELWADLADSLVGITASFSGSSGGSDHYPFIQNGFQATFVQEYDFSTVYHTVQDSTVYLNYEYMTRMVQASLATVYTVNILPPPVIVTSVIDGGDGQSLQLNWVPMDAELVDHFWIYYWPEGSSEIDSTYIPGGESSGLVMGLTDGQLYGFYVLPFNADGVTSVGYDIVYGRPASIPGPVAGLAAMPVRHGIEINWMPNPELDMDHYRIFRDNNLLPDIVFDTFFIDDDAGLGKNMHSYRVFPVDIDGNEGDDLAGGTVISKAAWLDDGRILAINRSHVSTGYFLVDETVTGEYMRQALIGFDYDYYSDTAHQDVEKVSSLSLYDLIDYELVIIGGESGRLDDLAENASQGGRLDTLAYYLSIGGKAIVFGRWGEVDFEATYTYGPGSPNYAYHQFFGIAARHLVLTSSSGLALQSDLIGGHAQMPGYPDLNWDSTATVGHSLPFYTDVSGVPCISYPTLDQPGIEILYTYNSSDDGGSTEGQAMAWRNPGPEYQYVYFELPLSFMERDAAVSALSRAVLDFGFGFGMTLCEDTAEIWAAPEAVNHIYIGNLTGGYAPQDIEVGSVLINGTLVPTATAVLPWHPGFEGEVMELTVPSADFAQTYDEILNNNNSETYTVSWNFTGETDLRSLSGGIVVNGYFCGDANTDGGVNVGDAVWIIQWVFGSGPNPYPYLAADANGDGQPNVGDAVYLIAYIFSGGPAPNCD